MLSALLAALVSFYGATASFAQDDPNEAPLGDVARSLRKKSPAPEQVIDDDNLSSVMQQAETRRASGASLKLLMEGGDKGFHVSTPDVTCSLSFASNAKALLSPKQYSQMNLPASEISKLEGPATIEGDALTVSVLNGTSWHVSELAVALTIIRKSADASASYASARLLPAAAGNLQSSAIRPNEVRQDQDEVRPEKKPDETIIYRMRAASAPWSTTVFSASLNEEIDPGEEWHWAIVEAKGYPPETYSAGNVPSAANPNAANPALGNQASANQGKPAGNDPQIPSIPVIPQDTATNALSQQPQ
jgi:hypothetical protein